MPNLSGGRELADLNRKNPRLGSLLARLIDAHNHLAAQSGIDPVGQAAAPSAPNGVAVTVIGEQAHIRITDNSGAVRAHNYFTEIHQDPNFTSPVRIVHHGVSRDSEVTLPTKNSTGATQNYYVRSYRQLPGSPPSGFVINPVVVNMAGTTQGDVPPSAGSGTSAANGTQTHQGFGISSQRKPTGPKRSV
jgi:hypothetical protein